MMLTAMKNIRYKKYELCLRCMLLVFIFVFQVELHTEYRT